MDIFYRRLFKAASTCLLMLLMCSSISAQAKTDAGDAMRHYVDCLSQALDKHQHAMKHDRVEGDSSLAKVLADCEPQSSVLEALPEDLRLELKEDLRILASLCFSLTKPTDPNVAMKRYTHCLNSSVTERKGKLKNDVDAVLADCESEAFVLDELPKKTRKKIQKDIIDGIQRQLEEESKSAS